MVVVPYTIFEQTRLLTQKYQGTIQDEDFGADVTMTIQFRQEKLDLFNLDLNELSHGQIRAEIIESNPSTIFPIGKLA
jgi:putative IMPACT (imprinted ancient) family translation regulator